MLPGSALTLKAALVIAQIVGYTLSKYVGAVVLAGLPTSRRPALLGALVLTAWSALLLFGLAPGAWKLLPIFINGLSLGMVWGLLVGYLEGRRTSEVLLAGLSCSFIVASGTVKDVGRWLMKAWSVSEAWMPFVTGALFLVPFFLSVALLRRVPEPTVEDRASRSPRESMTPDMRRAFVRRFWPALCLLLVAYFFLTAFRDYRDNYGVELFGELGYGSAPAIFSKTELPVAFGVMGALALLSLVRDNAHALYAVFGVMASGVALLAGATALLDTGFIDGATWMVLLGLGSYLAYVPFGSVLFDRVIAHTRSPGNAVFGIYIADALGYTGSIFVQLYKDLVSSKSTHLEFFRGFSYAMAAVGALFFVLSAFYFARWGKRAPQHRES
jgi:MFS family permease